MTNEQNIKLNEAIGIIADYILQTNNYEELEETINMVVEQIKNITEIKMSVIRENVEEENN